MVALNLIFQEEGKRPERAYMVGLLGGGEKGTANQEKVCKTDQGSWVRGKGLWGEGLQAPAAALPP